MKSSSPPPYSSPASVPRRPTRHHGSAAQASSARRHARAATLAVELSASAYPSTTRALTPQLADSPLHYSEDEQQQSDNLGDLTPTSNRTPSPNSALYGGDSAPRSPQSAVSTSSDASSILSLPPLSIPPRILDALHREIAEKSQLLSLANDHIHHQSVQIGHLQAKLTSYQEANNAILSANVGSGAGHVAGGRSEEVKQLKVLVSHLYNMIAQRDAIVDEQEKELHYYQQFMRQYKQDRENAVEREVEKERERDRDRERMKQLEMEVQKMKGEKEKERKEKDEREERKEEERGEREREREKETSRRRQEAEEEERKVERADARSPPSGRRVVRTNPQPPVPPPPLRTESPTASTAASAASLAASLSRPPSFTASTSPSSVCSPLSATAARQSPHGLLPKVRRASPLSTSASASSSPTFNSNSMAVARSATPPLMSLSSAAPQAAQQNRSAD